MFNCIACKLIPIDPNPLPNVEINNHGHGGRVVPIAPNTVGVVVEGKRLVFEYHPEEYGAIRDDKYENLMTLSRIRKYE